jgi:hypothetical protein
MMPVVVVESSVAVGELGTGIHSGLAASGASKDASSEKSVEPPVTPVVWMWNAQWRMLMRSRLEFVSVNSVPVPVERD